MITRAIQGFITTFSKHEGLIALKLYDPDLKLPLIRIWPSQPCQ